MDRVISLKECFKEDAEEMKAILELFGTKNTPATITKTGRRKEVKK